MKSLYQAVGGCPFDMKISLNFISDLLGQGIHFFRSKTVAAKENKLKATLIAYIGNSNTGKSYVMNEIMAKKYEPDSDFRGLGIAI